MDTPLFVCGAQILANLGTFDFTERNLHLPDKVYSMADNIPCQSKWNLSFSMDFPQEGEIVQHYRNRERVTVGYHSNVREAKIHPMDSSLKLDPLQFEMLGINLSNARDSLQRYYGKILKGEWSAKQARDAAISYRRPFWAKIVGECENYPIVASYCLSNGMHVFSQKEMPMVRFSSSK